MGLDSDISISDAKSRIENKSIGWSYLDQSIYCKELNQLVPLRNKIIKRTVLNTVETLIGPLRGKKTHSILGYVHKPYPPIYAALTKSSGFDTSLLIRGVEGGIIPSLRQKSLAISYISGIETASVEIDPKIIGIKQELRAISFPKNLNIESGENTTADYTVALGKAALSGEKGMFYDGLVYVASLILWHVNKVNSIEEAASIVSQTLDSGKVIKRII
jgi:anthranilate phosphoribosyltransferase